ncbi:MAG: GNAT family N-acetyltransferase [Flavobacteriaceae bacterium]|jgi:diamine N-acetyltransferase|nr:GNAT family N-acetyltransferase [Flavobacteriaceae bacterium]
MNYSAIHLRALEPSDLDFLFALENDQRLWTVSNTLVPFSKFTLKEYIAHVKDDIFTAKQQRFVISDAQNSALGLIDLYEFDPVHHRAGVGLVIAETLRGNGLGKKALALIEAYAFERLQLHQLYAGVGEDNPASLALFKAAGYEQCGLKKDWNYYNKEYHNEVVFQKIAHV